MNSSAPALTIQPVEDAVQWRILEVLLRQYANTELGQAASSSIWADLADLPARYGSPARGGAALAFVDGTPVGCGTFAATRELGLCELKRFYVLPAWRRAGIGKALVLAMQRAAQAQGYANAGLTAWPDNTEGLALYRALGFTPVSPFKSHPDLALLYLGRALPNFPTPLE